MNFDPNQFLDQETTQSAEKRPPLPVGDYVAVIGEITTKFGASAETGRQWVQAIIPLALAIDPALQHDLGFKTGTFTLTDRVFLDINDADGLDWGRGMNRRLRDYRVATGMNTAGEAFSLRRLQGRPVRVKVAHEMYQDTMQERIGGVAAAA